MLKIFVVAIIVIIGGNIIFKKNKKYENDVKKGSKLVKPIMLTAVLALIAFAATPATYHMSPNQKGVKINRISGKTKSLNRPGIGMKIPFVEETLIVDTNNQTYDAGTVCGETKKEPGIQSNTKDNIQVQFKITPEYRVIDANKLYLKRNDLSICSTQNYIDSYISLSNNAIANTYTYDDIKRQTSVLSGKLTEEAKRQIEKLDIGVKIEKVIIESVTAPDSIEAAIQAKIAEQQKAEASKYKIEASRNEAEAQKIKQKGASQEQQQKELCSDAIKAGNANSPSCYFGNGTYVNGSGNVAVK